MHLSALDAEARLFTVLVAELPESYYTPTPGQLRAAYAGQSNQLKKMGVDVNFSSRAQREKEERERQQQRASRWPKVGCHFVGPMSLGLGDRLELTLLILFFHDRPLSASGFMIDIKLRLLSCLRGLWKQYTRGQSQYWTTR